MNRNPLIRKIYLYLFTLVGLALITVGSVRLVELGLKTYVLTKADNYYNYPISKPINIENNQRFEEPKKEELAEYEKNQKASQRQRDAAGSLAMIIVGLPLYLYHWKLIKKDKEEEIKISDNA